MHVTQVAPYPVYPPKSGGSKRIHGLISSDSDIEVVRYVQSSVTEDGLKGAKLSPSPTITELRDTSLLQSATGAVTGWVGLPLLHLSPVLQLRRPTQLVRELARTDIVVVEHPWQFPYINKAAPENTPIVYSSHNVESKLVGDKTSFDRFVRSRVARLEQQVLRAADAVVVVSERDRQMYQNMHETVQDIHILPNGVPIEAVSSEATAKERLSQGLFVGSDHPPNIEAVENICRIARADETPEDFVFNIVGTVCEKFNHKCVPESVRLHGFVDSIDSLYKQCGVGLNPIMSGSGSNVKLAEYLARGLVVVSTEFGTRGYSLSDGDHLFVATPEEFATTLRQLLDNPEKATAVAEHGRQRVAEQYTWENLSYRYLSVLKEITK